MIVLGVHDGHDAAAALVRDGRLVAAVEEERLTRIKNHDTFPVHAVERVLHIGGCASSDIDVVAMNGAHQPRHRTRADIIADVEGNGDGSLRARLKQAARQSPIYSLFQNKRRAERESEIAAAGLDASRAAFVDHHHAHAAAAYWGSSVGDEPTLILTCDGAGDDLCATVAVARGGKIERTCEVAEEHSIGMVYLTVTRVLGMIPNEHEYKVMGLAPYGRGGKVDRCLDVFRSLIEFHGGGAPTWRRRGDTPHAFCLYAYLRDRLEGFRFDHIAAAVQQWAEETLCEWTRRAIAKTGVRHVALSGGVFMNVKANKAIAELDEVEQLFIVPSCGDESNAIGAAYAVAAEREEAGKRPGPLSDICLGDDLNDADIERAIAEAGDAIVVHTDSDLAERVATLLAEGEIVARVNGRSEFGARALGNRSLLADPSRPDVAKRLNEAIKNRDFWMPFAATVLDKRANDYIVNPKDFAAPYMIQAFDTTDRRNEIAAAIHPQDHTVRPQILTREANDGYYALIEAFEAKAGTGALLNTSFNLHGHPMVYSPADAIDVLRRSGLRWLLLGNKLVESSPSGS